MATDAPIKVIRMKVRCADEAEFRRELAGRFSTRLFVPTQNPLPKDTLFALHLKFDDDVVHVKGTARVLKNVTEPRKGMHAKFVSLDPDSLQFRLDFAPFEETGPVSLETLSPGTGEIQVPEHVRRPDEPAGQAWSGGLKPFDVLGNYQLLDRLGSGGMAEVFAARATMGGGVEKIVALKVVRPEYGPGTKYGGLFLNEAKISASLSHPNLIQVFDFGEAHGRPYLAMEFVRGRDLATVLQVMRIRGIKPSLAFCAHVVLEVVRALDYLHQRTDVDGRWMHLVHRDVSPGNILLSQNGEVKLVDFGVAAAGPQAQSTMVAGKLSYMPHEQKDGEEASPSWDLYAAGVVLYELLTLEPLFEGTTTDVQTKTAPGKREKIVAPSTKNPDVPTGLDDVVLTATNAEVQRRYSRARKMLQALELEALRLGSADVGATISSLFEGDLEAEKRKLDGLVLEGREKRPVVQRELPPAPPAKRPSWLVPAVVGGVALVLGGGALFGLSAARSQTRELDQQIAQFDERVASGALSGPGGDTALDHLAAARRLKPDDPRVRERAQSLAGVFEMLAEKALARGDDLEAAVHLQALLLADPARPGVADKLKATEARVRNRNRK